jgi:hypothetical protein
MKVYLYVYYVRIFNKWAEAQGNSFVVVWSFLLETASISQDTEKR